MTALISQIFGFISAIFAPVPTIRILMIENGGPAAIFSRPDQRQAVPPGCPCSQPTPHATWRRRSSPSVLANDYYKALVVLVLVLVLAVRTIHARTCRDDGQYRSGCR